MTTRPAKRRKAERGKSEERLGSLRYLLLAVVWSSVSGATSPDGLARRWALIMRAIKPIERLVRLSFTHCCASTCLLSTWWSTTALIGRTRFEVGFPLRCFQRLSRPHIATLQCGWRHNRSTRGASIPVLSYWGQILSILQHPRQIGTELSRDVLNPTHVPL